MAPGALSLSRDALLLLSSLPSAATLVVVLGWLLRRGAQRGLREVLVGDHHVGGGRRLVLHDLIADADARAETDVQEVAQVLALRLDGEPQVVMRVRRLL